MKRALCLVVMGILCLLCLPALANSWGLPGGLVSLFDFDKNYRNYTSGAMDQHTRKNHPGELAVFEMRARYHSELFVTRRNGKHWAVEAQCTPALPQPGDGLRAELSLADDTRFTLKILDAKGKEQGQYTFQLSWEEGFVPIWDLHAAQLTAPEYAHVTRAEGGYLYKTAAGSAQWHTPILLSQFSLKRFPKTLQDAQRLADALNTVMPAFPYSSALHDAREGTLPVFMAPSEEAFRTAKGKAAVSLKAGVDYHGQTEGWMLCQYPVSTRTSRFGWVPVPEDLARPKGGARPIAFSARPARLAQAAPFTDDPLVSQFSHAALPAGTELTWLATLKPFYAYVEAQVGGKTARGFVPVCSLESQNEQALEVSVEQALAHQRTQLLGLWRFYAGGGFEGCYAFLPDGELRTYPDDLNTPSAQATWTLLPATPQDRQAHWFPINYVLRVQWDGGETVEGIAFDAMQDTGKESFSLIYGLEGSGGHVRVAKLP